MRLHLLIATLCITTTACTPGELLDDGSIWGPPSDGNNGDSGPGDVDEGRALYDIHCRSCHGPDAAGGAVWPGVIQGYDPIHDIVANGRGAMPAVGLDDAEIASVQAYLNSFGFDFSDYTGEELFAAQCVSCHGPNGEGTPDGPVIQFAHPDYGAWVIRNGRDGAGYPGPMPVYPARLMSDDQLDEILTFLHDQPRPQTGKELYETFCAHCHGDRGEGGVTGKPIGGHDEVAEDIQRGKGGTAYGSRSLYMPAWGSSISTAEINLISAYVGSLPEP